MHKAMLAQLACDILVIDDEVANLRLLDAIVSEAGHRVRLARDAALALESIARRMPDLILLDVCMPGMDGYELCQRLKADPKTADIPVIFVSALHETADKVRGFDAGGVDYIAKPFEKLEVLARIATHLELNAMRHKLSILVEQRTAELLRVNRALRTLSAVNHCLVYATSEAELLNSVCRSVVEIGGYRLAWTGFAQQDRQRTITPAAQAGFPDGYVDTFHFSWGDDQQELGLGGGAIRSGQPYIARNILGDPALIACHRSARELGYSAGIGLPLDAGNGSLGVLVIYSQEADAFDQQELDLLMELAGDLAFGIRSQRGQIERQALEQQTHDKDRMMGELLVQTIETIALTLEKRDPYTAGHQYRVAGLSVAIAEMLGWSKSQIQGVRLGAMIHDIGKVAVPTEILTRPGALTELEFRLIKEHPLTGFEIMKDIAFPWPVAQMIYQHHERMDGSGYPQGIAGDEIIPEARIIAIADVVEAMYSHRPYRPAKGLDLALDEIRQYRGIRYDAEMVDACLKVFLEDRFTMETSDAR